MRLNLLPLLVIAAFLLSGCAAANNQEGGLKGGRAAGSGNAKSGIAPGMDNFIASRADGTIVDAADLLGITPPAGASRYIGGSSLEPTIAVVKSGVFQSGAQFGNGGLPSQVPNQVPYSSLYRSTDQGVTWKNVQPKLPNGANNPPASLDPYVLGDPVTGRVFTTDLNVACEYLNYSDDGGNTWTSSPIGCGVPLGGHDHQSLATGASRGTPAPLYNNRIVYYCVNRVGDSSCATSVTGGLNFGPLIPVFLGVDVEAANFCGGLTGHVKTDHAGRAFLPKAQCGVASIGVSEDDGKTWKTYPISKTKAVRGGDHEVAIAADAKDNLYADWVGDDGLFYFAASKDHGVTWTKAIPISPPGVTATDKPAIAAGAEGKVVFAYIGTTHPKGYTNKGADWAGASWNAYLAEMTDALAPNPIVFTTTANDPKDPIAVAQCGGTRCNGLYDFIDVQLDAEGRPWASFVDVCQKKCLTDYQADPKSAKNEDTATNMGFAGTLATGTALTAEGGALKPLLPQAPLTG